MKHIRKIIVPTGLILGIWLPGRSMKVGNQFADQEFKARSQWVMNEIKRLVLLTKHLHEKKWSCNSL